MARRTTDRTGGHWEETMSAFGGHPLHLHVGPLRAAAVGADEGAGGQLAGLGITDAEQLVALASIEEARNNLAATLDLSKQEVDSLVREAKKVLPAPVVAELDHPLPAVYPLGAVEPPPEARAAVDMAS